MTRSRFPTKAAMRSVRVYNSSNLAELTPQKVYISFTPATTGRGSRAANFQVIRIGFKTDPKGHWRDDGNITFNLWARNDRDAKLAQAIEWANAKFGKREWVRDPFGGYQDPLAVALIMQKVEEGK